MEVGVKLKLPNPGAFGGYGSDEEKSVGSMGEHSEKVKNSQNNQIYLNFAAVRSK